MLLIDVSYVKIGYTKGFILHDLDESELYNARFEVLDMIIWNIWNISLVIRKTYLISEIAKVRLS